MVKVRKNIVPTHIAKNVTSTGTNTKKYIVIHETDNTRATANADAHGRLQAGGNSRQASWHYTVDDKEAVQSFSDNARCWAAGSSYYNNNGIQIEICVNSDGNYKKAVENTVALTKQLMKKYNIPADNVIQHNKASGKNCPRHLRSGSKGITWSQFMDKVRGKSITVSKPKPKPQPSKPQAKPKQEKLAVDGYWGHATTRALQRYFGTTVDGVISGQPNNSSVRNIPSARVGKGGSQLIMAMQRHYGTAVDGIISNPSQLIRAMQRQLGTTIDGKVSKPSLMVMELQRRLNNGTL